MHCGFTTLPAGKRRDVMLIGHFTHPCNPRRQVWAARQENNNNNNMKINKYLRGKKPTHLHLQSTEEPSPGRCTPAGQCSGISAPWCRYQKVKNEAT